MNRSLAYLTLALSLAFAAAPLFSGDFTGFAENQLPVPQIDPPVQPAGYAFSIWGLIYAWLVAAAVYGLIYKADDPDWNAARVPLCVSLGVGVPWLLIAQISAIWATITIFIMAAAAIAALHRTPAIENWWMRAPIALYAGWLTAASFVSLATTLAGYGILMGGYGWAFAGIAGALIVAVLTYRRTTTPLYLGAVIWALVGIVVNNGMTNFLVTALAITGIVTLICVMAVWAPRPNPIS
ncbi:hypothetical protein ACOI1H_16980 [Loktanella sp. DJP18]|uniref:hypothetical protein n=1 Tax=Loktanella sp. DJP18 TaxID=3409788 RepID=UPI003BB7BEC0